MSQHHKSITWLSWENVVLVVIITGKLLSSRFQLVRCSKHHFLPLTFVDPLFAAFLLTDQDFGRLSYITVQCPLAALTIAMHAVDMLHHSHVHISWCDEASELVEFCWTITIKPKGLGSKIGYVFTKSFWYVSYFHNNIQVLCVVLLVCLSLNNSRNNLLICRIEEWISMMCLHWGKIAVIYYNVLLITILLIDGYGKGYLLHGKEKMLVFSCSSWSCCMNKLGR